MISEGLYGPRGASGGRHAQAMPGQVASIGLEPFALGRRCCLSWRLEFARCLQPCMCMRVCRSSPEQALTTSHGAPHACDKEVAT